MPKIWVVAPCYRDVPSFRRLRQEVLQCLAGADDTAEMAVSFAVLDDTAGEDPEIAELVALDDVTVIEPPFNLGHQRGLVYAVRLIAADIDADDLVVTLDSDGEDRPVDVPRILAPLLAPDVAAGTVVVASRTSRQESLAFKTYYALFRMTFRLLTGTVIRSGNFAAYRGSVAQRLLRHPHFDLCYSSSFISLDVPIVFVPCPRGTRYEGRSRMNRTSLVLHGLRMLMPFIDRIASAGVVEPRGARLGRDPAVRRAGVTWVFTSSHIAGWLVALSISLLVGSLIGLSSFVVLFASFAESRGISLSDLEVSSGERGSKRICCTRLTGRRASSGTASAGGSSASICRTTRSRCSTSAPASARSASSSEASGPTSRTRSTSRSRRCAPTWSSASESRTTSTGSRPS